MYDLVADIASYQDFLPWCSDARVLSQVDDHIIASVAIDFKGVKQSFTTQNLLSPSRRIEMRLLKGPFKRLHGIWQFDALEVLACKVALDVEFEFSSRLLGAVVGPVFDHVANGLVDSFHERARECYGSR